MDARKRVIWRRASAVSGAWLLWALACGAGQAWTAAFAFSACALALQGGPSRRPAAFVFWLSLTLYLSTFHWRGGDDIVTALLPFAILKHGTLAVDSVMKPFLSGPDGLQFTLPFGARRLSFYPVAGGIVAVPFYLVTVLARAPVSILFLHNLAKLSGSTITAASAALFCAAALRRCGRRHALAVTAVYAFGTWAFSVSSQGLWLHGPVALGLAAALYGACGERGRDALLCGFGLGLAVATRPDSVFLAAAIAGFSALRRPGSIGPIVLGGLPWAAQLAAYWLHYTGRLVPPDWGAQGPMLGVFSASAFWAMLASPTRGLLWFCPAALFGAWAAFRRPKTLAPWLAAGALANIAFLACYRNWLAGMTFGERYLSAPALALLFACVELEPELSSGAAALAWSEAAAFSIVTHALGAYLRWPGSFDLAPAASQLWDVRLHPILNLAAQAGPLHAWPPQARWPAVLAALGLWQLLAARMILQGTSKSPYNEGARCQS